MLRRPKHSKNEVIAPKKRRRLHWTDKELKKKTLFKHTTATSYTRMYPYNIIMFSVITNIYNKKTEGPTLMELFTATGKLKKILFLITRDFWLVHHGWHGTHRYDIQVLATHRKLARNRSTLSSAVNGRPLDFCLYRHTVPVNLFIPRANVHVCRRVLCVLCTKCTLHSSHTLNTCNIPTHKTTSPPGSGHFLTTYTRIA
jgi:hypothetical protein